MARWVSFFLPLGLVLMASAPSAEELSPKPYEGKDLACSFSQSCFARNSFGDGKQCQDNVNEVKIHKLGGPWEARMTRPNGSTTIGTLKAYGKYKDLEYLVFSSSDGSGASYLTVMPGGSAIWTAHFTLQDNVAYSHFGSCEEMN